MEMNFSQKLKNYTKHPFFGFILFGLILLIIPFAKDIIGVTLTDAIAKTLIFYVIALGFSLLIGYAGLASRGTAAFIGIGTFLLYSVMNVFNLPFIAVIILGLIIAIVL